MAVYLIQGGVKPTGIEDYVHRIGRTGRAGATGVAYTFFSEQDAKHASDLVKVLEGANQKVPVEIRDMAFRGGGILGSKRQWGSAFGGHDNARGGRGNGYNGRDGERSRWTSLSSSERGGRGYDRNLQHSDRSVRRSLVDVDEPGYGRNHSETGYGRNHSETMGRPAVKRIRSRSHSRSRSLDKGPVLGGKRIKAHSDDGDNGNGVDKQRTASRDGNMRRNYHEHMIPPWEHSPLPNGNQQHLPYSNDFKSKEYRRLPSPADGGRLLAKHIEDGEVEEGMISS